MNGPSKTVLIAGATGLVGSAILRHFNEREPQTRVVAVARRRPADLGRAEHLSLDLRDRDTCQRELRQLRGISHVAYAALWEQDDLVSGWSSERQIETNAAMLRNLVEPLRLHNALRHVAMLQGGKAYGSHRKAVDVPAREGRSELRQESNFYWDQEDYVRAGEASGAWSWTILRPQLIVGRAIGGSMNVVAALGTYAALLRERGEPLHFPGGKSGISGAIDVAILAEAVGWAGNTPAARNEIFNINNGDVFQWRAIWPRIAFACGMPVGSDRPMLLAKEAADWSSEWDCIRDRYDLASPSLGEFVGSSYQFLDYALRMKDPNIMSTIKLRRAGFAPVIDTEEMFEKWLSDYRAQRLLPMVD